MRRHGLTTASRATWPLERATARSRYVDTFNPAGADPAAPDAGPAPAPRPKPPAYKVFTPQKPADAEDEPSVPGAAKPLFMTPTADVYSNMPGYGEGEDGKQADANAPTR